MNVRCGEPLVQMPTIVAALGRMWWNRSGPRPVPFRTSLEWNLSLCSPRESGLETFDLLSRNNPETHLWETKSNKLDRSLRFRSFAFRSYPMSLFLKPLIGFGTSTGLLTTLMVLVSHAG